MPMNLVLVPDTPGWVIWNIARQIESVLTPRFKVTIVSGVAIRIAPQLFRPILDQADVVHCMSPYHYSLIKKIYNGPLVCNIHHFVDFSTVSEATDADRILYASKMWAERLSTEGVDETKLRHIPYTVDTELFHRASDPGRLRRRFNIPDDATCIGMFAKGTSNEAGRKGIDDLIQALRSPVLAGRRLHLCISGLGAETMFREALPPNITPHFLYMGRYEDMPQLYSMLDLYVVCSRLEGGPITILEALACEVPVVSTDVGIVRDMREYGDFGEIVPPGEPEELAGAIDRVLSDAALREQRQQAGLELVRTRYHKQSAAALIPVYEELVEAQHARPTTRNPWPGLIVKPLIEKFIFLQNIGREKLPADNTVTRSDLLLVGAMKLIRKMRQMVSGQQYSAKT